MNETNPSNLVQIPLDDEKVARFLQQNPDFFIRNAHQVEQMRIPHPVQDAVSLVEWQLSRQRQQIARLQEEITALMELARTNEVLFGQLLALQGQLARVDNLQDLLDSLQAWANALGLSGAYIRLFSEQWQLEKTANFAHLMLSREMFKTLRIQRMGSKDHYLGTLNDSELLLLLPKQQQVGSVALSLLGEQSDLGVLIFTNPDSQHYQPQMGTLLLRQLSCFLPNLLTRWVKRA